MSEDKNKGDTTRTTSQYRMMYGYYEDDYTLFMTREELMEYIDSLKPRSRRGATNLTPKY